MLGSTMDSAVNPLSSPTFNPTYALGTKVGTNFVTLGIDQMPSHTHIPTINVTIPPHTHTGAFVEISNDWRGDATPSPNNGTGNDNGTTSSATLTPTVTATLSNTGNNLAHQNNQPTIGCYYIMYIPA
jgi:microcystin-dependent protein